MKTIETLINKYDLSRFRILKEQTLFPPNWEALKKKACPLCGCKLKFPRKGNMAMCNGKKHGKAFIINRSKLPVAGISGTLSTNRMLKK